MPPDRLHAAATLQRSTGVLSTAATARMETQFGWFRDLSAEDRSWVGLIVQAGVRAFVDWYADASDAPPGGTDSSALAASVFGAAPRALAGVITLEQTVELVRLTIEVVETDVDSILEDSEVAHVRGAILRYAREVAFAAAEVYAKAAETRGAWDARLEALVVDAVLRADSDEALLSRASALGWTGVDGVLVVLGAVPAQRREAELFDEARRTARAGGAEALCAVQGDRLVVVLGGTRDRRGAAQRLLEVFDPASPVVVGPDVDGLADAYLSARAAGSAFRAAAGWPEAPRPVLAEELLPERVLAGDGHARRHLVDDVFTPLDQARGAMVETLTAYFASGGSTEATARALFVHANTVRYRLRQAAEVSGLSPTTPRDALTLQLALTLGRLSARASGAPTDT